MTQLVPVPPSKKLIKFLTYATMAMLIINFIFMFVPVIEIYYPTNKPSAIQLLGITGWDKLFLPMVVASYFTILLPGIPYLCSIAMIFITLIKKNNKSSFFKILNDKIERPIKFSWLKFAAISNIISVLIAFVMYSIAVQPAAKFGAYCYLNYFGILNIICSIVFTVLLFVLSNQTKEMFVWMIKYP